MAAAAQTCAICNTRRPRRACPGVGGDICTICCATEREVTVKCPFECVYLQQAREREPRPEIDPTKIPNADLRVTDDTLRRNEPLLVLLTMAVSKAGLTAEGAYDSDLLEAIEAAVKTRRTLESGLVYESRPDNPIAARLFATIQEEVQSALDRAAKHNIAIRDSDVLAVLVFLQRLGIANTNGRPKGRAFLNYLRRYFPLEESSSSRSPIITA